MENVHQSGECAPAQARSPETQADFLAPQPPLQVDESSDDGALERMAPVCDALARPDPYVANRPALEGKDGILEKGIGFRSGDRGVVHVDGEEIGGSPNLERTARGAQAARARPGRRIAKRPRGLGRPHRPRAAVPDPKRVA